MTRLRKVLRDLGETPVRTALAILAMAAGVFGVGAMLTAFAILERELARTFVETNPANVILRTSAIGDTIVDSVRRMPGVRDAEVRAIVSGRLRVGRDEWVPLVLFVIRDFDDIRVDRIRLDSDAWPREGEIAIERSAMSVAHARVGDVIDVSFPRQPTTDNRQLKVSGTVHAAGLAPGWMDHMVSGFVRWRDVDAMTLGLVADPSVAKDVAASLRTRGVTVERIDVIPPRHPHADQMETFLFLLGAFGVLAMLLSAVLVANLVHALLVNQTRHIGVMKTIGASTRQIVAMALTHVAILAAIALAIAMPVSLSAGRAYARFATSMLNASTPTLAVPWWVFAVQLAVGICVPIGVALVPIARTSRISIHDALRDDAARRFFGVRRGRLLLTIATLAIGGAAFIAAMNVSESWTHSIAVDANARRWDIDVRMSDDVDAAQLARVIRAVKGTTRVESWIEVRRDHEMLIGVDANTPLLALPLIEGRWLRGDNEAVVNQSFKGTLTGIRIVGKVRELGPGANVYASRRTITAMTHNDGTRTRNARVVTSATPQEIARALERAQLAVAHVQRRGEWRRVLEDHLIIIKSALFFAATLVVLVGALGLTSTLTLNVVSRTRELGVLSAIGATPLRIARSIVFEGVITSAMSWLVAIALSIPSTWLLDRATGRLFIKTPVEFLISPHAIATWLALVLILGAISSFYPAWRAARIPVREALAHE